LLELATEAAADAQFQQMRTTEGLRAPRVRKGIIATGDVFVASPTKSAELRESLGADAVEMEGGAVAQVCWQHDVPCLIVRSISDKADEAAEETL
ncbi:MAG: 5'-methylthioadenosine/adenosylhomocysteine nucleosidase, partial [Xanthomonadales bacterium]|uniref:5'-methylthioadenosine/S-adenosylhomocysteine nucleosidase n=1 Tax=Hydrogenophaga sp. TaxID=1904254 RepID=UPI001693F384